MIGSVDELCSIDAVCHWLGKPRTDIHTSPFFRPGADVDSPETQEMFTLLF